MSCIIHGCKSYSGYKVNENKINFHMFPKNIVTRKQWFIATGRSEKQYKHFWRVCSLHFTPESYISGMMMRACLLEDAVPTLNLHKTEESPRLKVLSKQEGNTSVSVTPEPQVTAGMDCPRLKVFSKQGNTRISILPEPQVTASMDSPRLKVFSKQQGNTSISILPKPVACFAASMDGPRLKVFSKQEVNTSVSVTPEPRDTTGMEFPKIFVISKKTQNCTIAVPPKPKIVISKKLCSPVVIPPKPPVPTVVKTDSSTQTDNCFDAECAMYEVYIDKLKKRLEKLETSARTRELKFRAIKAVGRRLKRKNLKMEQQLGMIRKKLSRRTYSLLMEENVDSVESIET